MGTPWKLGLLLLVLCAPALAGEFDLIGHDDFSLSGERHASEFVLCEATRGAREPKIGATPLGIGRGTIVSDEPRGNRTLYFGAGWCGPCKASSSQFPTLRKLGWRVDHTEQSHLQVIDVDRRPDLQAKYGVTALPTWVHIDEGHECARRTGAMTPNEFIAWVNPIRRVGYRAPQRATVRPANYVPRWTFPGKSAADMVEHLAGAPHFYDRRWLKQQSADTLFELHDKDRDSRVPQSAGRFTLFGL